jgi:hypothetical protein
MRIFISWSGELSHAIACILKEWIPTVLQAVTECWVSSEDIAKGKQWSPEITSALRQCQYGLICLVPSNLREPWLNFEAGVISKTLNSDRVCPFLFGLKPSQLQGPLTLFQCAEYSKDDVLKLLQSINAATDHPIQPERLRTTFELCWPGLERKMSDLRQFDLAGGKVNYLRGRNDIYAHAHQLLRTAEQRVRVLQFFGGPRPPKSYAEEAAKILRGKRDAGLDVLYDAYLVLPPSRIPETFHEAMQERFDVYVREGVGDLVDVYTMEMEYPAGFGFDMFLVDRKHAHLSFTTSGKLDALQRGITFEDQEPVVSDLVEWFDSAIGRNSVLYKAAKGKRTGA